LRWSALILGLALPAAAAAAQTASSPALGSPAPASLADDPILRDLIAQAMQRRPELAQARAQIQAEREREPQAGALPDPVLSLGIQNDGFSGIEIGKMPLSWLSIGVAQTFPWPGKRSLRSEVAELGRRQAEAEAQRAQLSVEGQVALAYLDLLLLRDRLALLDRLEALWAKSEALVRARYESGAAAQSDLLRAQLERSRLRQRRASLTAEQRQALIALNRLTGRDLDAPLVTARSLGDLADPELPDLQRAQADAEADSPELKQAQLAAVWAERNVELARKERWPDITVNAAVMPRWGQFDSMWQAGVSFGIPLWSGRKQTRGIAESEARVRGARSGSEIVRQQLRQRVAERAAALAAAIESNRLYRSGLLVQAEATVESTLAQYQVGRAGFASVLEALASYYGDRGGFLQSVATAQRLAIAEREIRLDRMDRQ
jgi:outer membrane protein, heavy metal efflux system